MLTKEEILKLLETKDIAIARALVVLNERQTFDEQNSEYTKHSNGRGFRPCHARMGTSMAKFFAKRGFLSPKQVEYWRKKNHRGDMRIGIYWKQLAEVAEEKQRLQAAAKQLESEKSVQVSGNEVGA